MRMDSWKKEENKMWQRTAWGGGFLWMISCVFLSLAHGDLKPALKPGMWEFHQVLHGPSHPAEGKILDRKKCIDPWKDMHEMNLKLEKRNCEFSPTTQSGNVYHFSATCPLPNGKKGSSTTDLTYQDESSYTAKIVSDSELVNFTGTSREELSAKRTGDCP